MCTQPLQSIMRAAAFTVSEQAQHDSRRDAPRDVTTRQCQEERGASVGSTWHSCGVKRISATNHGNAVTLQGYWKQTSSDVNNSNYNKGKRPYWCTCAINGSRSVIGNRRRRGSAQQTIHQTAPADGLQVDGGGRAATLVAILLHAVATPLASSRSNGLRAAARNSPSLAT